MSVEQTTKTNDDSPPASSDVQDGICALADGDQSKFASLFLLLAPRLKSYFLRLGASPSASDDLIQETMLRIWRKADRYDPASGNGMGWIFRIARNLRIDAGRRERGPPLVVVMVDPQNEPTPEDMCLSLEQAKLFKVAFDGLTPIQKEVLQRSLLRKSTLADVAGELNLPLSTAKSHLRRAISQIRGRLEAKQ